MSFAFHKPKVFRSARGCCICRAKSSSSRFTDSKRYEFTFDKCFEVSPEERTGEICNACVLLVKRFMKLPLNSTKNWEHVVDSRRGPGIKNKKNKTRSLDASAVGDNGDLPDTPEKPDKIKRKHIYRPRPKHVKHPRKRPNHQISRRTLPESSLSFLDFWKKTQICCGYIFIGPNGEVGLDPRYLSRCNACRILKEPAIPSTLLSAAATDLIRLEDAMETESVSEFADSTSGATSDSSCITNNGMHRHRALEDAARANKLALDSGVLNDFGDADEGFFDKHVGSPISTSSGTSTPPLTMALVGDEHNQPIDASGPNFAPIKTHQKSNDIPIGDNT